MSGAASWSAEKYLLEHHREAEELQGLTRSARGTAAEGRSHRLVVVGTAAERVANSVGLRRAFEPVGGAWSFDAASSLTEWRDDGSWELGIVLSPFKQEAMAFTDAQSSAAREVGVVDTVIRRHGQTIGLNTNGFGIEAIVDRLLGGVRREHAVVVGSGAMARCAVLALRNARRDCEIELTGRNLLSLERLGSAVGVAVAPFGEFGDVDLVVHATTWGETEDSEADPLVPSINALLPRRGALFDLNARVSSLQRAALAAGSVVVNGAAMQSIIHGLRAALALTLDGGDPETSGGQHDAR